MDVPEPPNVVLAQPAPCADGRQADDLLRRALAPSVAPHGAWTVTMRVTRAGSTLTAEGEITDESDALVAHRSLAKESRECGALARAIGVWASLVLDAEVERARNLPPPAPAAPPSPERASSVRPAPPAQEESAPDALFMKNPGDRRSLEMGAGGLYMDGLLGQAGPGIIGINAYSVIEVGSGWFLRPMLALGRSTDRLPGSTDIYATWGAARFDACGRIPGNYLDKRGIQVDLCGGTDLGFLFFDAPSQIKRTNLPAEGQAPQKQSNTLPLFAPGASIAMRGDLASDMSAEFRGLVGVNIVRESYMLDGVDVGPRLLYARLEVGLSWRFR